MPEEEISLSSLLEKIKQRIQYIKKHGNAFTVDWTLLELIEMIVQKLKKE